MKTKLKTLKDLDLCCVSNMGDDTKCLFPQIKLKAEAIKHYKAVKNGEMVIDVPTYIRWMFNITLKDLREERK